MIACSVTCFDKREFALPAPAAWRLEYGAGVPCDSIWLRFPGMEGQAERLDSAIRLHVSARGQPVFTGVLDEWERQVSDSGDWVELSGRGIAALLLDNEANSAQYPLATLPDILRNHVTPYGIPLAKEASLPAVSDFVVAAGSSEWQVLYEFARYYGGVTPRFDRLGQLCLHPFEDSTRLVVDDRVPVTALTHRRRRYGVLSEVLVRDKVRQRVEQVPNHEFLARGGQCRRVITMPGRSNYQAMRYSGQFQIDKSRAEALRVELTVPIPFFAWPGDLVQVARTGGDANGLYRVLAVTVSGGEGGVSSQLKLGALDTII